MARKIGEIVLAVEEWLLLRATLQVDGVDDLLELGFGVGRTHQSPAPRAPQSVWLVVTSQRELRGMP